MPSQPGGETFDEAADAAMVAGMAMEAEEKTAEAKTETPLGLSAAPFTTPEAAIAWGAQQGAFGGGNGAGPHARAAYNKLKTEKQPKDAAEMAALWRADVARRLAEAQA
jgi:hypothetical protein